MPANWKDPCGPDSLIAPGRFPGGDRGGGILAPATGARAEVGFCVSRASFGVIETDGRVIFGDAGIDALQLELLDRDQTVVAARP